MPNNDATPEITVDPETFTVRIDGSVAEPDPVRELPWPSATSCSDAVGGVCEGAGCDDNVFGDGQFVGAADAAR